MPQRWQSCHIFTRRATDFGHTSLSVLISFILPNLCVNYKGMKVILHYYKKKIFQKGDRDFFDTRLLLISGNFCRPKNSLP
jgi:hypothetical protein